MAFKSIKTYNEERYGGKFILTDDGDNADVIFLYRSEEDALVADTHYIKSDEYSGYVHCTKPGCPACAKGLRVQEKLFIPMYVIGSDEIQFWDRTVRFNNVMRQMVFDRYPNPSEYVFRITRHGVSGDVNTTYEITAVARNTVGSYDQILAKFNAKMPDYYSNVCKDMSSADLARLLSASSSESVAETYEMPKYHITPRGVASTPAPTSQIDSTPVTTPVEASNDADQLGEYEELDDSDVSF